MALGVAIWLGLPALVAATIAVAMLVLATGAFHEDGLADVADGFGGGHSVARKLEIMRDSGIGAYGVAALVLSIVLRIALLAALAERSGAGAAALALDRVRRGVARGGPRAGVGAAQCTDGRQSAVGGTSDGPHDGYRVIAGRLAPACCCSCPRRACRGRCWPSASAALVAWPVCRLSRRMIGGQTGDVAGATTQLADLMLLMALVARPAWG